MGLAQGLALQGIFLIFYGTVGLFKEIIFDMRHINKEAITPVYYPKETKYQKLEAKEGRGHKTVSMTKKEKRLLSWFMLIVLGNLFQAFSYLI